MSYDYEETEQSYPEWQPPPLPPPPPGRDERNLAAVGILLVLALVLHACGVVKLPFVPELGLPSLPDMVVAQPEPAVNAGPAAELNCGNAITVVPDANPIQQTKKTLWKFLKSRKLTDNQAAGIMGNIQAEGGFRLAVEEMAPNVNGERGLGMAQWSGPRRAALVNTARDCKKPYADLQFQIYFTYKELQERDAFDRALEPNLKYDQYGNQWNAIANQGSIDDATVAFHHLFEQSQLMNLGSGAAAGVRRERGPLARGVLKEAQEQKW